MKHRRQRLFNIAVAVAAVIVVVLVALIGLGYLVLPHSPPSPITISDTDYTILEGTNSAGAYWFCFASPSANYTNGSCHSGYTNGDCTGSTCSLDYPGVNGYPTTVAPGSTFYLPFVIWNIDTHNHTVSSILTGAPFVYVNAETLKGVPLPVVVPAGYDDANFEVWMTAPSDPGASLAISITINAANSA